MTTFAVSPLFADFAPPAEPGMRRRPPVLLLSLATAVVVTALTAGGISYHLDHLPTIDPAPGSAEAYVADGPLGGPRLETLTPPAYDASVTNVAPVVQVAYAEPQGKAVEMSASLPADSAARVAQAVTTDTEQPVPAEAVAGTETPVADAPSDTAAPYAGQSPSGQSYAGVAPDPDDDTAPASQ